MNICQHINVMKFQQFLEFENSAYSNRIILTDVGKLLGTTNLHQCLSFY